MMFAARIHEYGEPSVITIDRVPIPVPGPGEVLVKVAATSFNPSEIGFRRGFMPVTFPHTLGWDVAGTVVATGEPVIALTGGAAAGYAVVPEDKLVAAPKGIPLEHAAAIPVAGLTAWQAVFEQAEVRPGERVLIVGAGGGVGMFAVQLAKHAGATVVATASPRSAAAVEALGADEIVDHTSRPLPGGNDVVLNLAPADPPMLGDRVVTITHPGEGATHFVARNDPGQLAELVGLIDAGLVRVDITETHTLPDLPEIHARAESGQIRGKIIIKGLA
ncbi:NADP-dependent oxidoreductase [Nonomuraea sp. NPDC050536]|uniref:NADP-dependent oxidoreductase n=1 Tax=Nonomuraea sp. NPDC050536 TaxID=3364366 RepID=UPI0037CB1AF8